uniref:Uncharacterized protein n=1 Tax=Anguilla anguilla TaxID=7936 RepID=A0A0E9VKV9_ANGAN
MISYFSVVSVQLDEYSFKMETEFLLLLCLSCCNNMLNK